MTSRRGFVKGLSIIGISSAWSDLLADIHSKINTNDGIDWNEVRSQFPIVGWSKMQFNSGSAGVMPLQVRDYLIELIHYINTKAPYKVWGEWQQLKKSNLNRLAQMVGCNSGELQVVRNTTEALNMIIYGLRVTKGDEVIIAGHDYPFARNAWLNRSQREGIVLREITLDLPGSDKKIINAYQSAISEKTKAIHITHMTHRQGHIMPVKELTEMAHDSGVEVIIDGAHVVGQIAVDLHHTGCDYYASSLHKWLNAPLGTGLLYIRNEKINQLYNHPSSNLDASESMDKFEHLGTRAWMNEIGVSAALDFHELIGAETKLSRLQDLKEYWTGRVQTTPGVILHTKIEPSHSAAVATFSIDGYSGGQLTKILDQEYDIHAKSVGGKWGSGVRISVNVFTNIKELDRLVTAIHEISQRS